MSLICPGALLLFLFLCTHVPLVWQPHLPELLEPLGSQVAESLGVSTDCLVQESASPVPLSGLGQPYGIMCTLVSPCWIFAWGCPKPGFLRFLSCMALPNRLHTDLHSGSDSKTVPPQWVCKGQLLAEEIQIWELGEEKFLFCPVCTGSRENRESLSAVQFHRHFNQRHNFSCVCSPGYTMF